MASGIYNLHKRYQLDGTAVVDFNTDTIKVALINSAGVSAADFAAHDYFNDVTGEVSGTGYSAGGATLGSLVVTGSSTVYFDAADVVWSSATITARGAVIYKAGSSAASSPLIALIDFGSDQTATAGTFTIIWSSSGILSLT